jgi:hypothetical protein
MADGIWLMADGIWLMAYGNTAKLFGLYYLPNAIGHRL